MTTTTDRIDARLRAVFLNDMECGFSVCDTDTWADLPDAPTKHIGIYDPLPDLQSPYTIGICPDLIAHLVDGIDPVDEERFLDILTYIGARLVATYDVTIDAAERFAAIEQEVLDQHPDTARVWVEVSMRAAGLQ